MHCSTPVPVPEGLSACRALLAYEGPARDVVARLKYRNARSSLSWLVEGMACLVQPHDAPVAVTWAPTTPVRRRGRGFDQGEVLARRLAARLGLACPRLLARLPGAPQTGRSSTQRRIGPRFHVRASAVRRVPDGAVLLVDDVITTGATMSAAALALREAGLRSVIGLAAAHPAPPLRH
jgi:predicted amidophosphoribosyltransferase